MYVCVCTPSAAATFRFTMASYEVLENAGSVLVAIILESAGIIDSDIEIRVLTVSSGSASGMSFCLYESPPQ